MKDSLKNTWQHLHSKHLKHSHQLDHALANKDAKQYITTVRANERLPECSEDWEEFKILLREAADHTFGKKKVLDDWFDDQDEEIQELLKDKKLNRNALRDHIRTLKKRCNQKKAEEAESLLKKITIGSSMQL